MRKKSDKGFALITILFIVISVIGLVMYRLSERAAKTNAIRPAGGFSGIPLGSSDDRRQIIGFLPSWNAAKEISVEMDKLTQIIYFGLGVNGNGELMLYKDDGSETLEWHYFRSDYFKKIADQARENEVKVILAVKNFDNEEIDRLISSQAASEKFLSAVLAIIDEYYLDGLNIDFEYVSRTGFPTRSYLVRFLSLVSHKFKTRNPPLWLSFDLISSSPNDPAYDLSEIGKLTDEVILMAYDYVRPTAKTAGFHAPLISKNHPDITKSTNAFLKKIPSQKIILGVPFYGYEWQTADGRVKSRTVEGSGALATYGRVQNIISLFNPEIGWDKEAASPWLVYFQSGAVKQVYYEDKRSLSAKMDFVREKNLGGAAVWALGYESFRKDIWEAFKNAD